MPGENQDDLREGHSPWDRARRPSRRPLDADHRCQVLVVGAGITGAMAAERFSAAGRSVTVLDREAPGMGSTTASTAMLQWEIDRTLGELTDLYGFETASDLYRRSLLAVAGLRDRVTSLGLRCDFHARSTLYLAEGTGSGGPPLKSEAALRARAGLPSDFLDHRELLGRYGVSREAAIHSTGSAEADPVCLAHELLRVAAVRGARVHDGEAVGFEEDGTGVAVVLSGGQVVEAEHVILATGYTMPDIVKCDVHSIASTWAMATRPQPRRALWPGRDLIWEAGRPYSYMRTTHDDRVIIGGLDERAAFSPERRKAVAPQKVEALRRQLGTLFPAIDATPDYEWSGVFGETVDGLPLIGRVPGYRRLFAAYGYGGNGITFSFLAAQTIEDMMAGQSERWHEFVALDRPPP